MPVESRVITPIFKASDAGRELHDPVSKFLRLIAAPEQRVITRIAHIFQNSQQAMNTRHTGIAPQSRERSTRLPHANTVDSRVQIFARFEFDGDLADLGDAFAGSPLHEIAFTFDAETGLDTLAEVYAYRVFRAWRFDDAGRLKWTRLVLRFARDVYVVCRNWGAGWIYASSADKAEAIHSELIAVLGATPRLGEPAFHMLRRDGTDITADPIRNVPDALGEDFISLAYGEDAHTWIETFAQRTAARTGGLTILEGPPGTGKTSYVSELIRRFRETHVFYVLPVSSDGTLTSPDWVSFWQGQNRQHPDRVKVVVLEDAERVLLGRSAADRDAVAAVLNIADGLLGRMLKLHLLCSVNARFEELDPAIQRPGRLMNYRRFTPIPRERAIALAALRGAAFTPHPEVDEYTLAEVLQPAPAPAKGARRAIGFAQVRSTR